MQIILRELLFVGRKLGDKKSVTYIDLSNLGLREFEYI